nr:hypothetical protein [Actinomycetota bacterium]
MRLRQRGSEGLEVGLRTDDSLEFEWPRLGGPPGFPPVDPQPPRRGGPAFRRRRLVTLVAAALLVVGGVALALLVGGESQRSVRG